MTLLTFSELGVSKKTCQILEKKGYQNPTDIQSIMIPAVLGSSDDIIAKADTGTGKTGAFGIPLVDAIDLKNPIVQAIAIAPTRELASQVAKELTSYKGEAPIRIIELCGGQGMKQQIDALKKITQPCVVVGTPGRILDHINKKRLKLQDISWLVIDEVDEMLNFGFKEDMDKIVSQTNPNRRTIILSATLPAFVKKVAKSYLNDPKELNCKKRDDQQPSIEQTYYKVNKINKMKLLTRVIDGLLHFYGFVFCNTKREVDQLSEQLVRLGYAAESMHGDLSQSQRNRALERFKSKQCDILVVTDVAARGIDIKNISHVVNYSVPQNLEAYTHRIGRTGRAGQTGVAITFVKESEFFRFKRIIKMQKNGILKKEVPTAQEVMALKHERLINSVLDAKPSRFQADLAAKILGQAEPQLAVAGLLKLRYSDFF
ncbi:MAG: DEAD/DEAH box helicase [Candidatus Margulisbacteria bacterium]|nr:DEAD/DEAH box helicase [Candidatus Margulisiibacteriota bacterium]